MRVKTTALIVASVALLASTPALAHKKHRGDAYPVYPAAYSPPMQAAFPVDRALAERCGLRAGSVRQYPAPVYDEYRHGGRDRGIEGALIGGAVGGALGNRIAGRGDRTVGTLAGAAIGAVAGAAIDRAEDSRRARGPDYDTPGAAYDGECDGVLPPGYMLVSVPGGQECRDEVVTREEWVPEYETIPGRTYYRTVPERAAPRDKRTKLRTVN